jgi:sugar fermentation stimulation protein A
VRFEPALAEAVLERRYKRFLADAVTAEGERFTLHCPNTGSMRGCAEPGMRIWYSRSDNPKRKYAETWELAETAAGPRIGIHTGRANALVAEALDAGLLPELAAWPERRAEVRIDDSRVDFLLGADAGDDCVVEVKSVTLLGADGLGLFPDARSERARRHLELLAERARGGRAAALIYCVQHTGIERVAPADDIDPGYGEALRAALDAGVIVRALAAEIGPEELVLRRSLPVLPQGRMDP